MTRSNPIEQPFNLITESNGAIQEVRTVIRSHPRKAVKVAMPLKSSSATGKPNSKTDSQWTIGDKQISHDFSAQKEVPKSAAQFEDPRCCQPRTEVLTELSIPTTTSPAVQRASGKIHSSVPFPSSGPLIPKIMKRHDEQFAIILKGRARDSDSSKNTALLDDHNG